MSKVTLTIGPKSYVVACTPGQEAHISALGAMVAEKYALLGSGRAPLEAQNLLFAALFLADELVELRERADGKAAAPPQENDSQAAERLAERLEALADRAEAAADALEAGAANA